MNGVDEDCPDNCLSNFSLVRILLAVSTACLRSSVRNNIQYNFVGSVFLNTSKICGPPWPKRAATCLMHVTYTSMVSVFSSKLNDFHAWNKCSLVLPTLEYCSLNKFCIPIQSTFIGSDEWYHNLASPNSVKQNLWTWTPSTKWCAVIQSLLLGRWASASSSGFPENSGLKWDQFKCTICLPCFAGGVGCSCCCCWACCLAHAGAEGGGSGAGTLCTCSAISYL